MQFKELDSGACFRFVGDNEVMMKIDSRRYIRPARDISSQRLLYQDVGTVHIVIVPCKCKHFYRVLTEAELSVIEAILRDEESLSLEAVFERD